jgi:hypothetical protein
MLGSREFFNLFNHANFGLPDNDLNSPTAGEIRPARPAETGATWR